MRAAAGVLVVVFVASASAPAIADETAVDADGDAAAAAAAPAPRPVRWQWAWDDGLQYHLEVPFDFIPGTGPVRGRPIENRLALVGTVGARIQVDGAAYETYRGLDPIDGGAELRRARIGTRGDFYLLGHASYALDLEVIAAGLEVGDVYLWWKDVPWVQRLKIGIFTPPMALESVTSARDIVFMETGLPVEAFGPARSTGVEIGGPQLDRRLTWAVAMVRTITTTDQGDKSRDGGRGVARLTWLPQDEQDAPRLTHLGLGASLLFESRDVQYRTRPESHLAPSLVDTGALRAASSASVYGFELLHVRGALLAMGEAMVARVSRDHHGTATFWGTYALASWSVTGEAQPYDRASGILARFEPARPLSWQQRAWGAVRLGVRVSHIDLDDGTVRGGRETDLMTNVTWVLNRWLLFKLEYGAGFVRGRPDAGNLQLMQMRLQLDFY